MRTIFTSIVQGQPIGLRTYVTEAEAENMRKHPDVDAALINRILVTVDSYANPNDLNRILVSVDRDAQPDEVYIISGGSEALRGAHLNQWAEVLEQQEKQAREDAMNSY
jgi:hypothetical protein